MCGVLKRESVCVGVLESECVYVCVCVWCVCVCVLERMSVLCGCVVCCVCV